MGTRPGEFVPQLLMEHAEEVKRYLDFIYFTKKKKNAKLFLKKIIFNWRVIALQFFFFFFYFLFCIGI